MKKLIMDNTGLHILDEDVAQALSNKNLSPSMITGLNSCPAKWLAENYAIPEIVEPDPNGPAMRGTLFHEVMEVFFKLPANERSKDELKRIIKETLNKEEFSEMKNNYENIEWLQNAVKNYYKMGATPEKVKIAKLDIDGRSKKGLEIFVKGKIGNTKRNILGVVDRVIENPNKPGTVIIEDWKTGATVREWKNHTKSDDGLPEQRQQIIYTKLMKQKGVDVSGARLIYPVAKEIVKVQLENKFLEKRVLKDIVETDKNLTIMEENNTFEYGPSFLCSWCPLSKVCSVAQLNMRSEKMKNAYQSQPDPELLSEVIDFN